MNKNPQISVVINTLNEEQNLPYALSSVVSWVDEIILVDMYSEDRTVEIAKSYNANIYYHERLGYADPARAFAVSKATKEWILILDADEMVPYSLSLFLRLAASENVTDIINIPWLNYIFGKKIMHTGWGPEQDKHMRFFRKGSLTPTGDIHNFLKPLSSARILDLKYQPGLAIVHFNYIDINQFVEKMNRYTTIEARQSVERNEIYNAPQAVLKAVKGFFRRYIKNQGYKDGWQGFYLSIFWVFYRFLVFSKTIEQIANENSPMVKVRKYYNNEANSILEEYDKKC